MSPGACLPSASLYRLLGVLDVRRSSYMNWHNPPKSVKTVMLLGVPRLLYQHQYDRWMARVITGENEKDCWGSKTGVRLQMYIGGVVSYATIFSFLWHHGDLLVGNEVCHTCDDNVCGNPLHLWQGTHSQNMLDCVSKGRHRNGF